VLLSQSSDEPFVFLGFSSAQFVIEMNHRKNNANFLAQFEHQTKQRDRVRPARNRDANAIPGPQKLVFPNVAKYSLLQAPHGNIVQPVQVW
jgi:hypothetical protein